jgi:hypothetical protein
VTADSVYGNSPEFLTAVEERVGTIYFVTTPCDTLFWLQSPVTEKKEYQHRGKGEPGCSSKPRKRLRSRQKLLLRISTNFSGINGKLPKARKAPWNTSLRKDGSPCLKIACLIEKSDW